jgi:hypothetical protein
VQINLENGKTRFDEEEHLEKLIEVERLHEGDEWHQRFLKALANYEELVYRIGKSQAGMEAVKRARIHQGKDPGPMPPLPSAPKTPQPLQQKVVIPQPALEPSKVVRKMVEKPGKKEDVVEIGDSKTNKLPQEEHRQPRSPKTCLLLAAVLAAVLIMIAVVVVVIIIGSSAARQLQTTVPTVVSHPQPTNTLEPAPTNTQPPKATDTPVLVVQATAEPTNTPEPAPTDTPRPAPTATPLPAPTEVVLFTDDFETGVGPAWQPVVGDWRMVNGQLTGKGEWGDWAYTLAGDTTWTNYAVEVDLDLTRDLHAPIGVLVRVQDLGNLMAYLIDRSGASASEMGWWVRHNGEWSQLTADGDNANRRLHLRVEASDSLYTAYVNGVKMSSTSDTSFSSGKIGIGIWRRTDTCNTVDNIKVIPFD